MVIGVIVCSAALAWSPPESSSPPVTYAEARAKAGRSPDDQVRLALWCESHGLTSERLHHLTLAVLADPNHAAARGLMGMVRVDGRWLRPESVADRAKGDPSLLDYESRRLQASDTPAGHWALGLWAEEHGLPDQAAAHFTAVVKLDPLHEDAWKRLGFRKQDGRWVTEEQVLAAKAETRAQKEADRKWKSLLEECRRLIATPSRHDEGEAMLLEVTDPRAVPSIGRVFATTLALQPRAVELLGQIDSPESSKALVSMALYARSSEARRTAAETLRTRNPRDYAEILIALLGEPIRFEVKHVEGLDSPGELLIEGKRANIRRVYAPPTPFQPGDRLDVNRFGEPVIVRQIAPGGRASISLATIQGSPTSVPPALGNQGQANEREVQQTRNLVADDLPFRALRPLTTIDIQFGDRAEIPLAQMELEVRKTNAATEKKLRQDLALLEEHNSAIRVGNERVADVLKAATGLTLQADRRAWNGWYVEKVGYDSTSEEWTSRSSVTEPVSISYQPPSLPSNSTRQVVGYTYRSPDCFAAGTPVRTIAGPRAIESIRVGDKVLAQSTVDGSLVYRAVVAAHRNPVMPTCRVMLGGQPIVSSQKHRFWVAERGWVMARDLRAGDPIRTLGGVTPVQSVEPGADQLVYNLDVASDADYFAGPVAALVHDNSLPDPRLVPFDRTARSASKN